VLDPEDIEIFEFIKKKTGLAPKLYLTNPERNLIFFSSNFKSTILR